MRRTRNVLISFLTGATLLVGAGAVAAPAATAAAQAPIRINAGGGAGTFEGVAWEADRYYTGGTTSWSADAVSGTGASALYQARRVAPKGYDIPVAAGTYDVTLHTAETWFTADGKRVFSATAEGATVFSDLDLHKVAGHDKAYTATTRVSVTDGILDLDLSARTNNAVLAGITVTPLVPTSQPAPTTAAPAPAPTTAAPAPAPTTVAPAPAPTTAAPAPSTSSWKAPTLVNPIVWTPSASNRIIKAPADRDVLVRWPSTPVEAVGGFEINGGRNVVSIGGTITFTKRHFPAGVDDANKNRALYITGNSSVQKPRTVHVEGLHIAGTYTWEGINIDSKKERGTLTVQLRDITVDQVNVDLPGGTGKHYGGDALQPWNGPHVLRVDGFDARGLKYQGLFLQGTAFGTGDLGRWDIRNVYLEGHKDGHGYLLWRAMPDVIDYENIRVRPRPGTSGDRTVQRMSTDWPGVTILS